MVSFKDNLEPPYLWRRKNREHPTTGKAPISIRIDIKGFPRAEWLTKIKATEAEWNSAAGRKVELRSMSPEEKLLVRQDNKKLAALIASIEQVYATLRSQGGDPSPADLRNMLNDKKQSNEQDVLVIMRRVVEQKRISGKTVATLRSNRCRLQVIEAFVRDTKARTHIQAITRPWIRAFERWCIAEGYKRSSISIYFQLLRQAISKGLDEGWIKENPFFQYRMEAAIEPPKKRHLTTEDLRRLTVGEFVRPYWRLVADSFLFSCYTGLSFMDYQRFAANPSDFIVYETGPDGSKVKGFSLVRQKLLFRNNEQWVPLFPEADALLQKYEGHLPILDRGNVGKHLKRIARQLQLTLLDLMHKDARSTFAQLMRDRYGKTVAAALGMHTEEIAQKHYSSESAQSLLRELSILGAPLTHN